MGLRGVINQAKEMIEKTPVLTPEDMRKVDFWNANIISCEAVIRFAHKFSDLRQSWLRRRQMHSARRNC